MPVSDVQTSVEKTIIAANVIIKGELTLNGPALIAAQVQGTITSSDLLEIGAEGNILGDIVGTLIDIQGKVRGNVTASEACRLGSNAELIGELRAANLAISEGATFVGKVFVGSAAAVQQEEVILRPGAQPVREPVREVVRETAREIPREPVREAAREPIQVREIQPVRPMPQPVNRVSTLEEEEQELALAEDADASIRVNGSAAQGALQRPKIIRAIR
jgi:cytoskeletal protein CcmA (bactofilin family)